MRAETKMCEECQVVPAITDGAARFCSRPCYRAWQKANPTSPSPQALARRRAYGRWYRMVDRCQNPNNQHWSRYGGRGIYVCLEWHDFETYYRDTGDAPDGMTVDRIDNDGPYSPENTRWATPAQQRANQEYDHMRIQTHCKHGHAFDEANTYVNKLGHRNCRECQRAKMRRRRAARKAAAA